MINHSVTLYDPLAFLIGSSSSKLNEERFYPAVVEHNRVARAAGCLRRLKVSGFGFEPWDNCLICADTTLDTLSDGAPDAAGVHRLKPTAAC